MRKVLIIAYRFPPQGGAGAQRTLKFVKYLRRFGWWPVVHTAKNPYWPMWDESLLQEIPENVSIYRTRTFEFERLEKWLGNFIVRNGRGQGTLGPNMSKPLPTGTPGRRSGTLSSLRRMVHHRMLMPDPQIAWLPWALAKSLYIAQREDAEVIYTTSPPNSSQLLGLLLKRILRKPWVADFRDPWTDGFRRKQAYVNNRPRRRLEESWERAVVERTDYVVVNTEKNKEQFLSKYPFLASRLLVLTNGFDPVDFAHVNPEKKLLQAGDFNLTLTGTLEAMFDAAPFFQAVKELLAESPEMRAHLRVNFIGTKKGKHDNYIEQNNLGRYINYVGYVPHADSVQYLAESDVLFFCQIPEYESASVKLQAKLFEYLYVRKPILALTLPGVTTDLLEQAGLGVVVNPNDVPGIKRALYDLYRQWQQEYWHLAPDDAFIGAFDRVRLTERLAMIFDAITSRST